MIYCYYSIQYTMFSLIEKEKNGGYDVNDLLRDTGELFEQFIFGYIDIASYKPPYPVVELDEDLEEIAEIIPIEDMVRTIGYEVHDHDIACPVEPENTCPMKNPIDM